MINFPVLIAFALVFFGGNLLCQFNSGRITIKHIDYSQGLNAAFTGILLGFGFNLIREIEQLSNFLQYIGFVLCGITMLSFLSGLLRYLIFRDSSRFKNSIFILTGLFSTDSNEGSFLYIFLLLSRFTWELPQTLLGYIFAQSMNIIGRVGDVRLFAGTIYCVHNVRSRRRQGVSIGNFIYVKLLSGVLIFEKDPLLLHEFGHHLQSRRFGLLYLLIIGIPSLISAIRAKPLPGGISTHDLQWYELQANRYAAAYLFRNHQVDWDQFEPPLNSFPRTKSTHLT